MPLDLIDPFFDKILSRTSIPAKFIWYLNALYSYYNSSSKHWAIDALVWQILLYLQAEHVSTWTELSFKFC